MKALSVKQPWAYLICAGYKDIENRDWKLPLAMYGERIYIHTGKGRVENDVGTIGWIKERLTDAQWAMLYQVINRGFARGAIIGEAAINYCVESSNSPWFVGKYGFVLKNPVLYDKPIPCRGALGFFEPDILKKEVNTNAEK